MWYSPFLLDFVCPLWDDRSLSLRGKLGEKRQFGKTNTDPRRANAGSLGRLMRIFEEQAHGASERPA